MYLTVWNSSYSFLASASFLVAFSTAFFSTPWTRSWTVPWITYTNTTNILTSAYFLVAFPEACCSIRGPGIQACLGSRWHNTHFHAGKIPCELEQHASLYINYLLPRWFNHLEGHQKALSCSLGLLLQVVKPCEWRETKDTWMAGHMKYSWSKLRLHFYIFCDQGTIRYTLMTQTCGAHSNSASLREIRCTEPVVGCVSSNLCKNLNRTNHIWWFCRQHSQTRCPKITTNSM